MGGGGEEEKKSLLKFLPTRLKGKDTQMTYIQNMIVSKLSFSMSQHIVHVCAKPCIAGKAADLRGLAQTLFIYLRNHT